jgi:uncharacterized protein
MVFIEAASSMNCSPFPERIMKCPQCQDVTLTIAERQGVEIDYCPQCRGIWLDRGELDKLIERAVPQERADDGHGRHGTDRHGDSSPRRGYDRQDTHSRRRKSWLGDLFD